MVWVVILVVVLLVDSWTWVVSDEHRECCDQRVRDAGVG